jgi:hypothetical protein
MGVNGQAVMADVTAGDFGKQLWRVDDRARPEQELRLAGWVPEGRLKCVKIWPDAR